jgi:crossover junction endodeoxyribonuclease RusA
MADYEFTMPWPPSVNAWKSPFRNRMILTKRGREYREEALNHLKELGFINENIDCNVSVSLVLNPPTLRRYDIDNFCKSLFDAMTIAKFWIDDEQINRLSIQKGVKTKGGNIEVKINLIQTI